MPLPRRPPHTPPTPATCTRRLGLCNILYLSLLSPSSHLLLLALTWEMEKSLPSGRQTWPKGIDVTQDSGSRAQGRSPGKGHVGTRGEGHSREQARVLGQKDWSSWNGQEEKGTSQGPVETRLLPARTSTLTSEMRPPAHGCTHTICKWLHSPGKGKSSPPGLGKRRALPHGTAKRAYMDTPQSALS